VEPTDGTPDIDFVLASREGDLEAFAELYARHAGAVMRYAWSQLRDRNLAEDVLQETFATAWAKRRSASVVDHSLLPWLLAICRNHARNQIRRNERTKAVQLDEAIDLVATPALAWIDEALATLSAADRRICELCLIDGYSYRQAADIVESTPAAVAKRLQRSRARLRDYLETTD
jgi:RNA polymerase sigma-70 factor (ECF subfamily)